MSEIKNKTPIVLPKHYDMITMTRTVFDREEMKNCPFPVIPKYLAQQNFPQDFLYDRATVTHIWTQDREVSKNIALAALIPNICNTFIDSD